MNPSNARTLQAVLRNELSTFIHKTFLTIRPGEHLHLNWHIEALAWHLKQCVTGNIKRLIITLPPRHLKSIAASVALPAWILGRDPTRKIICASYSQELALKHARDTRAVMEAPWYQALFPHTRLHRDKNSQGEFMTTRLGFRLATSIGGTLTGRGGNLVIIDDPHKPEEATSDTQREAVIAWYRSTLLSRLDSKRDDVIIVIQQRLHEADLAGVLLESGEWVHLDLPAIAEEEQFIPTGEERTHHRLPGDCIDPVREPREVLDRIKAEIGSYAFAAQYQQRPAPMGGGLLKWEWFKMYENPPSPEPFDQIIQSWDCASKAESLNDYSVGTTWRVRNNQYYLLDVVRDRLEFPELHRRITSYAKRYQAERVLIEDAGAGTQLIQSLRRDTDLSVIGITPKDNKTTRAIAASARIEAGRVYIPKEASWLADFQREIANFPNGRHDDQVDSLTQFVNWIREDRSSGEPSFGATAPLPWIEEWDYLFGTGRGGGW